MAEHKEESLVEKIASEPEMKKPASTLSIRSKIHRLFGKEKAANSIFFGGNSADVFLRRNKRISAGVFGGATALCFAWHVNPPRAEDGANSRRNFSR